METNTTAMTAYAPQLGMLARILNGLTALQFQVRDEVAMALFTNESINRTMPYTAGDLDELTWFVQAKPGHDYSQLEVSITCKDDIVQEMLKAAPRSTPTSSARSSCSGCSIPIPSIGCRFGGDRTKRRVRFVYIL